MMNTGTTVMPSEKGLLTTVGWKVRSPKRRRRRAPSPAHPAAHTQLGDAPTVYALEGSVAYAGSLVQWLRDNLGLFKDAQECEALARSVDDHGGMFIVPAFAGLFAPYWRADARAAIVGLTAYNTKAHFARAAIDAAAYQVNEVLAAMRDDSGGAVGLTDLKVDGGMTVNELLMQFQADLCDVAVTRPVIPETTALGAAYAAGLATGFFADTDELKAKWKADKTWKPDMPREKAGKLAKDWAKAVTRTFDWAGEE
jgi:glycerol kinase